VVVVPRAHFEYLEVLVVEVNIFVVAVRASYHDNDANKDHPFVVAVDLDHADALDAVAYVVDVAGEDDIVVVAVAVDWAGIVELVDDVDDVVAYGVQEYVVVVVVDHVLNDVALADAHTFDVVVDAVVAVAADGDLEAVVGEAVVAVVEITHLCPYRDVVDVVVAVVAFPIDPDNLLTSFQHLSHHYSHYLVGI
jgi:hypothetical protein